MKYQGKTALITGASSGIGETFSYELAQRGMNLVLVARSEDKLQKLAAILGERYQVQVTVIGADLSQEGAAAEIYQATKYANLKVDMLINNAAFGNYGRFEQLAEKIQNEQIKVNIAALMNLTYAFLPQMQAQREGVIVNVASMAAFQPTPYMAVYGATKAFVLSFTEALREENRKHGVQIMALCPGATETAFYEVAGELSAGIKKRSSKQVIATALKGLAANRGYAVDGLGNYLGAQFGRFVPRSVPPRLIARMTKPDIQS